MNVFENLWPGGYYEGDVLNPHDIGSYTGKAAWVDGVSALHATYLKCIKDYVDPGKTALEIGPSRGAWSKTMLGFGRLICIDPVSPEKSGFNEYVGLRSNVQYITISDFSLSYIIEESIDYVFSFGCLCHVSFDGICAYAVNLKRKVKPGADIFWMITDDDQFRKVMGKEPHVGTEAMPWFSAGLKRTCTMLEEVGYKLIQPDVGTCPRDPIIHFTR